MTKLTIKDLRAIRPYETITREAYLSGRSLNLIFIKLPNHQWTGYVGNKDLTDRELVEYGEPLPRDEVKDLIECDKETFDRYEILTRGEVI